MPHKCPGPGCPVQVPDHMLMCRPHWFKVPLPLRSDVWATWNNGRGAGRADHGAAMQAAIRSLRKDADDA